MVMDSHSIIDPHIATLLFGMLILCHLLLADENEITHFVVLCKQQNEFYFKFNINSLYFIENYFCFIGFGREQHVI
ncbi:hypothetical protein A9Q64_11480 [Yersinia ruckeri]|nr:hypothetical protein A9Q64_11480 [Yersinia ruckeri]